MDAETIRLIVTATAAVIAGLGGAGITGWINRKNTTVTLNAARETNEDEWRRTREREHTIWLRDSREKAYVAFFNEAQSHQSRLTLWPSEEVGYETLESLEVHRSRIRLVGSQEVRERARHLVMTLGKALKARNKVYREFSADPGEDGGAGSPEAAVDEWKSNLRSLRESFLSFTTAVRLELGTDVSVLNPQDNPSTDIP